MAWPTSSLMLRFTAIVFLILGTASQPDVFERNLTACASNPNVEGYEEIAIMNAVMDAELAKIENGTKTPEASYDFPLCPNTDIEATDAILRPRLSNSTFACSGNGCRLFGGTIQVFLSDSTIANYTVENITLEGINFVRFSTAAIDGSATSTLSVEVHDCQFLEFANSSYAVAQSGNALNEPFSLRVSSSSVRQGERGVAFWNSGGRLELEDVEIINSDLDSVVVTDAAGSTTVQGATIATSAITSVFSTLGGGQLDAANVTIRVMQNLSVAFEVVGSETTATLNEIMIEDNTYETADVAWEAVQARDGATVSVSNSMFTDLSNLQHLFSSTSGSRVEISDSGVRDVAGGRQYFGDSAVSAIAFAGENSELVSANVTLDRVTFLTAAYFAAGGSSLALTGTCVLNGESQAAIFLDESSNIQTGDGGNFFDMTVFELDPNVCADEDVGILVKENAGADCFEESQNCSFECTPFFDADVCIRSGVDTAGDETDGEEEDEGDTSPDDPGTESDDPSDPNDSQGFTRTVVSNLFLVFVAVVGFSI